MLKLFLLSQPSETPLLKVRLRAARNGELAGVQLNDNQFTGEIDDNGVQHKLVEHVRFAPLGDEGR